VETNPVRDWKSPAPAAVWQALHEKAEQGDVQAQFTLGLSYSTGSGQPEDQQQAAKWYLRAADQEHALAQFNLGLMLATGTGLPTDPVAAIRWIRRAAAAGDASAQFYLGNHCHRASLDRTAMNQPALRIESYLWFRLAAAQGYKDSELHAERLVLNMSREEVVAAEERLSEHSAEHPSVGE
jgi:TPR repeat protein